MSLIRYLLPGSGQPDPADPASSSVGKDSPTTPGQNLEQEGRQQQQSAARRQPPLTLMDLPPEIHLLISSQLIYPDALSFKHTSRYFYSLVNTGVDLKIDWLVERRRLHLECPNNQRCDLGSDLRFCRGSVRLLMQRRREHIECESRPGLGCLVYGTRTCTHRKKLSVRLQRWLRIRITVEMWWIVLALIPLLCCWVWMVELLF